MNNIPSDEELILLMRSGDSKAYATLIQRFCGSARKGDIYKASPSILQRYSLWEVSPIVLSTFWSCVDGYRFGKVRFHTYYISSLRYALMRFDNQHSKEKLTTTSLENPLSNDGSFCLHDILSTSNPYDDPKAYLEYYETLQSLGKLPKSVSPETLDIVKLKIAGLSFNEIASATGLTYRQVYTRYQQFVEKATHLIKSSNN